MIERICKNCRLFDDQNNVCCVNVLIEGEQYELPVLPYDKCHWERINQEVQYSLESEINNLDSSDSGRYFKSKLSAELDREIEVKQIRAWSDGKNGFIERPADETFTII